MDYDQRGYSNDAGRFLKTFSSNPEAYITERSVTKDHNDLPDCFFVTTEAMRDIYHQFTDVVFVNSSFKDNRLGRPLLLFFCIDNYGETKLIAIALVREYTEPYFAYIAKCFNYNMIKAPQVMIIESNTAMYYGFQQRLCQT